MKKIITLLVLTLLSFTAKSQNDVSVIAITAPVSGCALTATENVTIRIFNYGATLAAGSSFNVSYTINAGVPVTELVTLGSTLLTNSTLNYTFTTQANLSVPGTYTFDASCNLVGDINTSNDAITGYSVVNTANSVGGTITGPSSVCLSGNSGNLTLSGNTGNVLRWEYSIDGGFTWINVTNTTTTQPYNNLTVPTQYRAVVQNGGCATAFSTPINIAIDNPSVGGTIAPASSNVCISGNTGNLTLSGRTGNVVRWEFSTDGGLTWTNIANTTATNSYTNLTQTTIFRALVQNGSCSAVYSSNATVNVAPLTVGGAINPATTTVCAPTNSGSLTLSGHTGSVVRWEFSIDGGLTWSNITNTTTTQNFTNLTLSRLYRARIQSGSCTFAYSATAAVNVTAASVGGAIAPASTTVCSGANSGTLTLGGNIGNVVQWENSTDGGITWNIIANTTTTENYTNLVTTTLYRALVQSSGCTAAYSATSTITVSAVSVGGTTASASSVCSGSNSGTLTLSGNTGSVVQWESSTDGGLTWSPIANTTASQAFTNLTQTTMYQVIVQSGVCPTDTSSTVTITVDPITVGGTIAPAGDTVCSGSNSGTLTLGGQVGNVVRWEFSTDGGLTWISISNTASTQAYNNITTTTIYRALVQSGVCSQAYSAQSIITVEPVPVGGTLYSDITVCGGANAGTLTLVGHIGNIAVWESSTDGGITWTSIANTTYTENYLNLVTTTMYRVLVASGGCPNDTSNAVTVTVDAPSVGGIVTADDTVCSGANGATLNLSGQTGGVSGWEYSLDGGVTWLNIANTTASQAYVNLTSTTMYRVRVTNGVCPSTTSDTATITVDAPVIGGTLSGGGTVCSVVNSGTIQLSGYSGNIVGWETSPDNGLTWIINGNTTPAENFSALTDTLFYRVILSSGTCGGDTSDVEIVYVDPATVPGTTSVNDTVCYGNNSGTVYLNGQTGAVVRWEMSTDGGNNWIALSSTADSLNYLNLTTSTIYRALVLSGVCAPAMYSTADTITVDPQAIAGTISGGASVCEGTGSGVLIVNGVTGTIADWEFSTDGGVTWTSTGVNTATLNWSNPSDTTWYHVIVLSGACGADTSAAATIITYPKPVAAFSADTVCLGNATTFTNTTTVASGGIQFQSWTFGDNDASVATSPVHIYGTAGTFPVTLITVSNNSCSDTATQNVIVNALPNAAISFAGFPSLCSGDSLLLSVAAGPNWYSWNTGDTTANIFADTTWNYVVTVTDSVTGCVASDSVSITILPSPIANAGADTAVSAGASVVLLGSGGSTFFWSPSVALDDPNTANPVCTPVYNVTYTLTVTDANGCVDTDAVVVTLDRDLNLIISNVITANGDGFNDTWNVQNIEFYTNNHVTIYNRNGMEVYEAEGYNNSWNGTYNDAPLPDGTYYYVLEFPDQDQTFTGAITIVTEKK
jgi:gliding motility-associated-like protein